MDYQYDKLFFNEFCFDEIITNISIEFGFIFFGILGLQSYQNRGEIMNIEVKGINDVATALSQPQKS